MSDERKWEPESRQAEGSPGANENKENIKNEQSAQNTQDIPNGQNTQSGDSQEGKRPVTHPYSRYNPYSQNPYSQNPYAGDGRSQNTQAQQNPYSSGRYENRESRKMGETGQNGSVPPRYGYYQVHEKQNSGGGNGNPPRPPRNKNNGGGFWKKAGLAVILAVIFGVVSGVVFFGMSTLVKEEEEPIANTEILQENSASSEGSGLSGSAYSVADVAAASMPSVVAITSVSVQEIPDYFGIFGYGTQQYQSAGSGSGIIVGENDDELLIATNNHVVAGATTLSVCFIGKDVVNAEEETQNLASGDGDINVEDAVTAKIKGTDEENDLAVVAVEKDDIPEDTMKEIKIAQLGSSDDLTVGEQVVAIGNALGYGQSVTSGWVSALNRSIATDEGTNADLIQTDAAINPGNSGGALLNMKGEVIGINSAKYADNAVEGMGYAIPISKAQPILEDLMNRKTRDKVEADKTAYLGVTVQDLPSEVSQMYNMPSGAFVTETVPGEAADKAGIKKGDIVEKLDGQKVTGNQDLVEKLQYYEAGETVEVVVARADDGEYKEITMEVTLGTRPQE